MMKIPRQKQDFIQATFFSANSTNARTRRFRAANQSTSADQKVKINYPREKTEQWLLCFPHELKCSSGGNDRWIRKKTFRISNGLC